MTKIHRETKSPGIHEPPDSGIYRPESARDFQCFFGPVRIFQILFRPSVQFWSNRFWSNRFLVRSVIPCLEQYNFPKTGSPDCTGNGPEIKFIDRYFYSNVFSLALVWQKRTRLLNKLKQTGWNFEITFSWLYPSMKNQVQVRPIKLLIIDLKLQPEKHWPRRDSNPQSSDHEAVT